MAGRNKHLTRSEKEKIIATYHMLGTYAATARKHKRSQQTVRKVLREAETDPSLAAFRAEAVGAIAGRMNGLSNEILDSIQPEELSTERLKVYDDDGLLKRVITVGPTLKDKVGMVGVLADKQKILTEAIAGIKNPELMAGSGDITLLLPTSLVEAKRLILQKVKRLQLLDGEFKEGEAGKRINMALNRNDISEQEIEDADVEPFD